MADGSARKATFSEEEIITFVKDTFCLSLKKDDLYSSQILSMILYKYLEDFGVENINQLHISAAQGVSDIERYEECVPRYNLWKMVAKFLRQFGINDFTLGDIMKPKRAKTLRVLWYLTKLWFSFSESFREWRAVESQSADKPARREQIKANVNNFKHVLETKSYKLAQIKDANENLKKRFEDIAEKRKKKGKECDEIQESSRQLKMSIAITKQEISEIAILIGGVKQQIEELNGKIICSPEKILSETAAKEKQLEDLREEKVSLNADYVNSSQTMEGAIAAQGLVSPALCYLTDATEAIENLKDEINNIEELRHTLKSTDEQNSEMRSTLEQKEADYNKIGSKKSSIVRQHNMRVKPIKEMVVNLQHRLEDLTVDKQDSKQLISQEDSILKKLKDLENKAILLSKTVDEFKENALQNLQSYICHQKQNREALRIKN